MVRRILETLAVALLIVSPLANSPLLAHHGNAAFGTNQVELKGKVVEYDWENPHVVVVWDVKNANGTTTRWSGELASVSSMLADGLTKNSLKPGDDVVITVKPAKSGAPTAIISQIKRADGTMVLAYSRRGTGPAVQ